MGGTTLGRGQAFFWGKHVFCEGFAGVFREEKGKGQSKGFYKDAERRVGMMGVRGHGKQKRGTLTCTSNNWDFVC